MDMRLLHAIECLADHHTGLKAASPAVGDANFA